MSPEAFKNIALGPGSSDPEWQLRRRRVLLIGYGGLFLVLFVVGYVAAGDVSLQQLVQTRRWPAALGGVLAALASGALAALLSDRWAYLQRIRQITGDSGAERIQLGKWVTVAAALLVILLPIVLLLPGPVRAALYSLAFTVLAGITITVLKPWSRGGPVAPAATRSAGRVQTANVQSQDQPPLWLRELLANLPPGIRSRAKPEPLRAGETSPIVPGTGLEVLFGGLTPTQDQIRFFNRFINSFQELVSGTDAARNEQAVEPSADLLVEGDPGSGKTTTLIACALYAAFVRGQRVLFIVPDELRQTVVKQRIDAFLKNARLHYYVSCSAVSPGELNQWLNEKFAIPHVIVGTPQNIETHLYGCPARQPKQSDLLRRLILLLEVLIVDDFTDFQDPERSHLPFMLDKQRLLLEAEYLPLQVVVSCPRLAQIARPILGRRLFTEKRLRLESNVLHMHPRPSDPAWRVDLSASAIPDAIHELTVWCLKRGLDVVLYRQGIDEHERQRQQQELARRGNSQKITVISDLDQPLHAPPLEIDAIFYQVAIHHDICQALRLRMGHAQAVIFSFVPEDEVHETIDSGIVPVVVDRTATHLLAAHLRSALRFMPPHRPVPADIWLQFGIRDGRSPGVPQNILEFDEWKSEREYGSELWPYISPRRQAQFHEPINVHVLSQATTAGQAAHAAVWKSSAGQFLREVDLVHLREVRLVYGTEVYAADEMRQTSAGIEFRTQNWHGNGYDAYLPIYDIDWTLPPDQTATPLGGGPDFSLLWFNLQSPDDADNTVNTAITALMTEYAFVKTTGVIRFSYPARFCALLFDPRPLAPDQVKEAVGRSLAGAWKTNGDARFRLALTGALNYAFQARVPGLSYFAHTLAFALSGDAKRIGSAVAFFVEPRTAGRTVMPILGRLLTDARERHALFRSVEWFLNRLQSSKAPQDFLRRFARCGFEGDDTVGPIDEPLALAHAVLRRAEIQRGSNREESPPI